MTPICNLSIQETETDCHKAEASLGYRVLFCLKKQTTKKKSKGENKRGRSNPLHISSPSFLSRLPTLFLILAAVPLAQLFSPSGCKAEYHATAFVFKQYVKSSILSNEFFKIPNPLLI